ncbi:MAG: OsmC family protein [Bacteroidota bacterium]
MKVSLKRLNQAMHFESTNEDGNSIQMDGSPDIGGEGKGVRPMELLLMAAAGCSSIDVVLLLKKMRQDLQDIQVEVEGDKVKLDTYSEFKTIHLHYTLTGNLKPEKVEKAISLSVEKYCSVSKALEKASKITYSFDIAEPDAA